MAEPSTQEAPLKSSTMPAPDPSNIVLSSETPRELLQQQLLAQTKASEDQQATLPSKQPTTVPAQETETSPRPSADVAAEIQRLQESGALSASGAETLKKKLDDVKSGKLTDAQLQQALRVIETVNDPQMIDKFLQSGGVALLAKLDGLPPEAQKELVSQVAKGHLYFADLNEFLDKYHNGQLGSGAERDQKLKDFIEGIETLGSAARASQAMDTGGVAKVISTAGTSGSAGENLWGSRLGAEPSGSGTQGGRGSGNPAGGDNSYFAYGGSAIPGAGSSLNLSGDTTSSPGSIETLANNEAAILRAYSEAVAEKDRKEREEDEKNQGSGLSAFGNILYVSEATLKEREELQNRTSPGTLNEIQTAFLANGPGSDLLERFYELEQQRNEKIATGQDRETREREQREAERIQRLADELLAQQNQYQQPNNSSPTPSETIGTEQNPYGAKGKPNNTPPSSVA